MHLVEDDEAQDDELTILEHAEPALLREYLQSIRKMHWDEKHFQNKLCLKIKAAEACERGSLACFLTSSNRRSKSLQLLEKRLLAILEEAKAL